MELLGRGGRRDMLSIADALRGIAGPLLRNLRRFEVLSVALDALPVELRSVVAPYDVRMAPPAQREPGADAVPGGGAQPAATGGGAQPADAIHVNTLYMYVASATAAALIEQRKRQLLQQINTRLAAQLIEDIRCEQASAARIAEQLNILAAAPD